MSFQPKGAAPVSKDVVEGVRKKMAAPPGPPPSGMFNAPRSVSAKSTSSHQPSSQRSKYYDEDDHEYNDGRYDDRDYGYSDEDDYYSDQDRRRDSRDYRDYPDDDERDYRYDGGRSDRGRHDDRAYDNYSGQNLSRQQTDRRRDDAPVDDREEDLRPIQKPRPTEDHLGPSAHAQSKQYSAGGVQATAIEAKPSAITVSGAKADGPGAPEPVRRDVSVPTGPATSVVSAYLAKARTNILSYQPVLRATYRELKYYVTAPCPPGVTARCYIERNRSGSKMIAPYYSVCADLDGKLHVALRLYTSCDTSK